MPNSLIPRVIIEVVSAWLWVATPLWNRVQCIAVSNVSSCSSFATVLSDEKHFLGAK